MSFWVLPLLADGPLSAEPGLDVALETIAKVLDWSPELDASRITKLREFVAFAKPYCVRAPGSVKGYERFFLEMRPDDNADLLHSFAVNHRLSSNAALEYVGVQLVAARVHSAETFDRAALWALPKPDYNNAYPQLDYRTILLNAGDTIAIKASLLDTHVLSVSRPGRHYFCGAVCIGTAAEADISMRDSLVPMKAVGTAPFIWRDYFEDSFLRPIRSEEHFSDSDADSRKPLRSDYRLVLDEQPTGQRALKISNLGPEQIFLDITDPSTIPWMR